MKDFLKALILAPIVLPRRAKHWLSDLCLDTAEAFTCWILGHDQYKGVCVRCGYQ